MTDKVIDIKTKTERSEVIRKLEQELELLEAKIESLEAYLDSEGRDGLTLMNLSVMLNQLEIMIDYAGCLGQRLDLMDMGLAWK
jgi:chaperonin cofactor prefoldin